MTQILEQPLCKRTRKKGFSARRSKAIVRRILALQDKGRALYAKADDLTAILQANVPIDEVIEVPEGRFAMTDNFANGNNVAFRQARVKRFELKKLARVPHKPAAKVPAQEEDALPA